MADRQNRGNGATGMVMIAFLVLMLLTLFFMPRQGMTAAWEGERNMMRALASERFDEWILMEAGRLMDGSGDVATSAIESAQASGLGHMAADRVYVAFLWLNLIVYRVMSLMLWTLVVAPFVLAASADGYYTREIRKDSFVAQSPIRHKMGAWMMQATTLAITGWLFIPFAVPPVVAPGLLAALGAAIWLWIANLQKRI
jgi:hypothetical protein